MTRFVVRRVIQIPLVLLAVSAIIFFSLRLGPFDATALLQAGASDPAKVAEIKEEWGLNDPIGVQYFDYLKKVARGDLGRSFSDNAPVRSVIGERLPATIELAVLGMVIGLAIGISTGVASAIKRDSWVDGLARGVGLIGISLPGFWLGVMLISLLAVKLQWLPAGGRIDSQLIFTRHTGFYVLDGLIDGNFAVVRSALEHMVMPAIVLGLFIAGFISRMTRTTLLETLGHDYIRTAYAKGATRAQVIRGHALRNALLPLVTISALQFGLLLGGAAIVETVFAYPGMGKLLVDAITVEDFPQIQASILIIAAIYCIANLIVDLLYPLVDPRVRLG
jgi:ABC-type dipeptide/oligopeptide/nickel transport system permease component